MNKRLFILLIIVATTALNTIFYDAYSKTKLLKQEKFLINKSEISPQQLFERAALIINHQYLDKTMNNQDWNYWVKHYKNKIKTIDDAYVAIDTMIVSLDEPYTRFLRKKDLNNLGDSIVSKICGIGVNIYSNNGNITILNVIKNSPAEDAKLKSNDIILKIDDFECENISIEEASSKIRGEINTNVILTIKRGNNTFNTTITRKEININTIETQIEDNIGYIKIDSFLSANMTKEVEEAFEKTKDTKGLIIDLRNNTGGLLSNATQLADKFINEGCIVKIVSKNGTENIINANPNIEKHSKPTVILINNSSASASEIFSGAMKDHNLATLIGENTYGKGLVQSVIPLPNETGINITVAKYLTPNNNDINKKGIAPHITVASDKIYNPLKDTQLIIAKKEIKKLINNN